MGRFEPRLSHVPRLSPCYQMQTMRGKSQLRMNIRDSRGVGILLLRIGVATMMLCHGWPKLLQLLQGQGGEWMDPLGMGSTFSLALCVFAEFFCSLAVLVGFFTRLAALVLMVNFWVAVFVYGAESSWTQNELPLLYLLCFMVLVCTGSGPLALDHVLLHRMRTGSRESA